MEAREGNLYTHPWRNGGGWEEILVRGGGKEGRKEGRRVWERRKKGGSKNVHVGLC